MSEILSRLTGKGLDNIKPSEDSQPGLSRLRGSLLRDVKDKEEESPVIVTNRDSGDYKIIKMKDQPERGRTLARLRSVATGAVVSINSLRSMIAMA